MTHNSPSQIGLALFDRYLSGNCTPEEVPVVERWLMVHPEGRAVVAALRAGAPLGVDVEENLRVVRARMAGDVVLRASRGRSAQPGLRRWLMGQHKAGTSLRTVWYAAAALLIGAVGVAIGWSGRSHALWTRTPVTGSLYTTANGERANITLPDGSTVALDVASRLEVPADFAAGHHTVRLHGEALFTVTRHGGTPFTVVAGGTAARVLGTSFAVRHYATDTATTVAVREGKVAVGALVVPASRQVEVFQGGVARVDAASAGMFDFALGVMRLPSMPLRQAIPELNRWFAADIRLGDPAFGNVPVKGNFVAGSLSDLANILGLMLDARVVRDGHVLTLYPKGK